MQRIGVIYKVTSPSGKVYIGQTVQKLAARKWHHFRMAFKVDTSLYHTKFSRAIRKYKDKLEWGILYENVFSKDLNTIEVAMILKYDSYKNGYNGTTGGYGRSGNPLNEKTKNMLSKKYSESGNPFYGNVHSKETKKKMSESSKGQVPWNKGISHTIGARKNISNGQKRAMENGNKGKLNWQIINTIREEFKSGKYNYNDLAEKYSVTKGNIGHILRGKIWLDAKYIVPVTKKSILGEEDIVDIIKMKNNGSISREIEEKYGVSKSTVWKVIRGKYEVKR